MPSGIDKSWKAYPESSLYPSITLRFEDVWPESELKKAKSEYEKCVKELESKPMMAKSCHNSLPDITTKNHSIFIDTKDCQGESELVKSSIISLLQ